MSALGGSRRPVGTRPWRRACGYQGIYSMFVTHKIRPRMIDHSRALADTHFVTTCQTVPAVVSRHCGNTCDYSHLPGKTVPCRRRPLLILCLEEEEPFRRAGVD